MKAQGVTQAALAKEAGVTPVYVNRVLMGRTEPSVAYAESLAKGAGWSLSILIQTTKKFSELLLTAAKP